MRIWTIGKLVESLIGTTELPKWPPDLFAVAASILADTGSYVVATRLGVCCPDGWPEQAKLVSDAWRCGLTQSLEQRCDIAPPEEIRELWRSVIAIRDVCLLDISSAKYAKEIIDIVKLMCIADSACAGIGIDSSDSFLKQSRNTLATNRFQSLTKSVALGLAQVLPKQHTPQNGLNLRSLSHHLALIKPSGVCVRWQAPVFIESVKKSEIVNVLLCPWPEEVLESDFDLIQNPMDHGWASQSPHRFFKFEPKSDQKAFEKKFDETISKAVEICKDIHIVVFPELSLSEEELAIVRRLSKKYKFLIIAGVRRKKAPGSEYVNCSFVDPGGLYLRTFSDLEPSNTEVELESACYQDKHHRWSLDANQIIQYGLGSRLPISKQCWEWTPIEQRELNFWTVCEWLTWATLICEDLARQDPVADIIRAVAPNLVIALLMDGPQLRARWPARFATVLSEDPGSSVLTLTSLGMSKRSQPLAGEQSQQNVIALWRDSCSGTKEIQLPDGAVAVVLSLSPTYRKEWSADGRSDGGASCVPTYAGLTAIKIAQFTQLTGYLE